VPSILSELVSAGMVSLDVREGIEFFEESEVFVVSA
jgi:hypothetical protein